MNLQELRAKQKELISLIYKNMELEFLPYFIFYSYIGARICYASSHPLALFYEEKFQNIEKFRKFLLNLKNHGHYSIFAHTPIFVNIKDFSIEEKYLLAQNFYKVFWDENNGYALFNLRHLAENLEEGEFAKLLNVEPDLSKISIRFFKNFQKIYEGSFEDLSQELLKDEYNIWAIPEVIVIEIKKEHPFRWIGVIVNGFSRIFSHQFVRHTWLNFNQRSHRYTQIDKFVLPENFDESKKEIYERIINESMKYYKEFCKDIKKESARFIVPQGVSTTVLATGPFLVWNDFINKRAIPQAQNEIRNLAKLLKENLI